MRIGYYQYHPEFGAPKRNLEKVEDALARIDADIIVLPELAFTGYFFEDREELHDLAEDVSESPTVHRLSRLCKNNAFHLVVGFAERCKGRLYNTALVIGPSGLLHRYRKLHLFNTEKENRPRGELLFTGQSQIVGPKGEVIASSNSDEEAIVICDIDLSCARNKFITDNNNLFADRRPEFYASIV